MYSVAFLFKRKASQVRLRRTPLWGTHLLAAEKNSLHQHWAWLKISYTSPAPYSCFLCTRKQNCGSKMKAIMKSAKKKLWYTLGCKPRTTSMSDKEEMPLCCISHNVPHCSSVGKEWVCEPWDTRFEWLKIPLPTTKSAPVIVIGTWVFRNTCRGCVSIRQLIDKVDRTWSSAVTTHAQTILQMRIEKLNLNGCHPPRSWDVSPLIKLLHAKWH